MLSKRRDMLNRFKLPLAMTDKESIGKGLTRLNRLFFQNIRFKLVVGECNERIILNYKLIMGF